jgi:cytochrome c oxidase cbb3-type subunit 3
MLSGIVRIVVLCAAMSALVLAQQKPSPSPASKRPPASKSQQSYPAAQIKAGESRFAAQCGFCHGRDAAGGESGSDLTRSTLVAEDVRGDKLGPAIRQGRPEKGMPPFTLDKNELAEIVAFLHDAKRKADTLSGGRRSVDVEDLQTGNAAAGQRYFEGTGGCVRCHAVTGEFATVGARYKGLALLQRMLYPGSGSNAGSTPPAKATVKTSDGKSVTGTIRYRDEFTITITDADGWTHSWPLDRVDATIDNPLQAHIDQLAKYTDADMHDVLAYLQTLR